MTASAMVDSRYEFANGYPIETSATRAWDESLFQRAVVAYRFWYPTVSMEGIFHGNREIGLNDNRAIGILSAGPRQIGFTLNSDTPYGAAVLDLSAGPMVVELPPGPYIGLVDDHHQRWITDLGIPGPDRGRGGAYVIVPPGYAGALPERAHVGRSASFKVLLAMRALPLGGDLSEAMDALREVRVHPLGAAGAVLDIVDTTGDAMDSTCLSWEDGLSYWQVLHGVLETEPVVPEFLPLYGLLGAIGIERGARFAPDRRSATLLTAAARAGRDHLLVSAFASARPDRTAWPDRRWEWVGLVADNGDFRTASGLDLEARDRWFAQAITASPAMFRRQVGGGSLYWLGVRDRRGDYLDGGATYTLDIPCPVPAGLFWSVTVYDAATRSQIQAGQGMAALRSLFELRDLPPGGPVRLHFGPIPPDGAETRWLQTVPGRGWFACLRIYGPEEGAFDGTWKPGDFERTS
ncbi:DUF1214 domain-containing protein [Nocardia araoensis]|uniref:DUF1214 domain-containing protein n=1 Tax=Nocardia araoensis TaxID=228600 RepID=UPI00058485AE|nr:DUF1214 domain-containing protein [Nocardia araoensis]